MNFLTLNIGSDAPQTRVADSEKLDWVMHVTGIAPDTPLHSTGANGLCCLIIVEVPKGHMEGIHSVVSQNLVFGTLVLIVGDACDVTAVLHGLPKVHNNQGLIPKFGIACFIWRSLIPPSSMGFTEL